MRVLPTGPILYLPPIDHGIEFLQYSSLFLWRNGASVTLSLTLSDFVFFTFEARKKEDNSSESSYHSRDSIFGTGHYFERNRGLCIIPSVYTNISFKSNQLRRSSSSNITNTNFGDYGFDILEELFNEIDGEWS